MFEVVLALFIMTLVIVAIVILSTNSVANSNFSRTKTLATRYTQEAVEWIRSEREKSYADFIVYSSSQFYCLDTLTFSNPGRCSSSSYIPQTELVREVEFTVDNDLNGKTIINATVITYWNDSKGYHETRSSTYFSDVRER